MGETTCASPGKTRLQTATGALADFARLLKDGDALGIATFGDGRFNWIIPVGPAKSRVAEIAAALGKVHSGGDTPLGAALETGTAALKKEAAANGGAGEYILVPVTDGDATDVPVLNRAVISLSATPAELHTIGLCVSNQLADPRWGSYVNVKNGDDLAHGLTGIAAEATEFKDATWTEPTK
jgi:Ca-activated chloride channel family protein